MRGLLATGGGLLAILLVPLALAAPTAWLLLPVHALFTVLALLGTLAEGAAGWPQRARMWGAAYLVATAAMVASLALGADARAQGIDYWGAPWLAALLWGWTVPVASGFAGWMGQSRQRQRNRRAKKRRTTKRAPTRA